MQPAAVVSGELANTGSDMSGWLPLGAGVLLLAGLGATLTRRTRRA